MTALYDVGQQKTTARGAGLSLTKTFRWLTICALTDFCGTPRHQLRIVLGRRMSASEEMESVQGGAAARR
ncbi:hypothetical protein [Burkholderia pyrrocinia]|uniref:hypothetical protein n=1 Tax=Burkholderia pyrrocinia TaxID=60550 RepID=UPI00158C7684|nr:hypothetical protein [Burkholderia pyrrocinia]